ncbi:UNVERIFIED_CONTAM: hypothetical protein GTU68_059611 [Idotea baltica]|nr:hypothetical protein [Idotea baltica]
MSIELTRNFSIIAHIDHGKTTLSDRLLDFTKTVAQRDQKAQLLDSMDLERERGITIKSHPVCMNYPAKDGVTYQLNLLDTPGHVDFAYEVSRSLAACEGALLLIDAAQGVEAQTVANIHLANQQNLRVIPVINKIDLPSADVPAVLKQLEDILQIPADEAIQASAKEGIGIEEILEAVVARVPPPSIFDSIFDTYRGVVSYVRVMSGTMNKGDGVRMMSTGKTYEIKECGVFTPKQTKRDQLNPGDVGYIIANVKSSTDVKIGDTITGTIRPASKPLPGFKEIQPMVFSGIYPVSTDDLEQLKLGMGKLQINDAAFTFQAESSAALGFGFRCGFLGLLHMEIVQERLRREFNLDVISTYPGVVYKITKSDGEKIEVDNPTFLPEPQVIETIEEPMVRAYIMTPNDFIGEMMKLVAEKRGELENTETLDGTRVLLTCLLPLNEILVDFNDKLKSMTRGYGSMDYEHAEYRPANLVKLDMMISGEPVDAFSVIVHRDKAEYRGRHLAKKLKEVIPQQLFTVAIQATIGGKIIARESISALRKNVTAKCYGGDISRKRKLLEKQKEGKKRMKSIGKVNIPQDAFIKVLKND